MTNSLCYVKITRDQAIPPIMVLLRSSLMSLLDRVHEGSPRRYKVRAKVPLSKTTSFFYQRERPTKVGTYRSFGITVSHTWLCASIWGHTLECAVSKRWLDRQASAKRSKMLTVTTRHHSNPQLRRRIRSWDWHNLKFTEIAYSRRRGLQYMPRSS